MQQQVQGGRAMQRSAPAHTRCRAFSIAAPARARRGTACCAGQQPLGGAPVVVLTREQGKNEKMAVELAARQMRCIELPLIEHTPGEDRARLPSALQDQQAYDWVAVTSPEAATVFLEAWQEAGRPEVRVAVVGAGTGEVLRAGGVQPAFTPSKALGKTLGSEMPRTHGTRVLYPASAKASTDLQDSLVAAGFTVTRLHTYNTRGVKEVAPELLAQAAQAPIVTFGSPSAVKAWVALVGLDKALDKASVCIGSTSARACESAGLKRIYHPEAPGIDGWVRCVEQAAREMGLSTEPAASTTTSAAAAGASR